MNYVWCAGGGPFALGPLIDFARWTLQFMDTHNGAVTAVATVFIAVFTIVLAYVTARQAKLTDESVKLGRDEFIASHRPKFEIREPYLATIQCPADGTERIAHQVRFILANSGDGAGTIVEGFALVMEIPHGRWQHLAVEKGEKGVNNFGAIALAAGAHEDKTIDLPAGISEMIVSNFTRHERNEPMVPRIFLRGYVGYVDKAGTRRRTAFCRPLDYGTKMFVRTDDRDYDYAD
jgi:hypothetical protein